MPISPTGSSSAKSSSFRGPLDLAGGASVDYGRSPDRSNDGLPSASSSNAAKHSPVIPDDHPMPWELYEHQGVTPPPLPSPTRTVFTFTTSPATVATAPSDFSSSNAGMARMPSNSSRGGAAAAAEQDHLHLTTTEQSGSNLAGPVSPHSAGSSGGGSIQPASSVVAGTGTTDSTVTTPPSALRSPGGATSGFFAALRPASPRITTTGSRDDASTSVLRRDKERTSSTSTTGNNTADAVPNASSSSHQRVARDPKTLDARSRRPSSVFEHVGNVFERWGKKVHHRSESKEGRSATPVILSSSAGMSGSALAVASEEEHAPASSSSQAVEYLDSPSLRPTPPPLLRNWSGSSALSMYDDFEVVSRPQQAAAATATSAGVPAVLGRTLIQVTEDNERFAVVDVSGLSTAAGIKERMLSKLHRFDDDSSTFSIHRTEIGLSDSTSDGPALGDEALFTLCAHSGDDKGNLKFLVSQLGPPSEPNHDAMPPPMPMMSPRNRRTGGSELPAVFQQQSAAAESSGGSPRSPVVPAGASALAYMHGKSNSISSLSSTGDFAQQQQGGYDSGSDISKQPHRIGSGSLTRSKMIRRGGGGGGGGGAASGDESQQQQQQLQHRRSSITGSPRVSTRLPPASSASSTAAAHHREQRSGSLGADRAPSSHVLGDAHARMRQTSDSATHAHSHSHSHQDIAEEVEELRISLSDEGGGSTAAAGGSTSGEPSSSSASRLAARDGSTARPTPQQHTRRNVSGSRRPATSQGALGGDPSTSVAGPPPASAPFTTTSYDINDAARMYSHHETASPSTPGVNSSGAVSHAEHGHGHAPHPHQLYAAGSFEEHLLRARRGSDVGPQTQASAQQQQQHARNDPFVQGAAILPEELIAAARSRGSDDRYPSMTVARASASSASSADSGASGTSGQQQQGKQGSGSGSGGGSGRQPIDYESLNARHGLRPGAAGAHIYGSSAPSSGAAGAAAAVFASPPQMMMGPGSPALWTASGGGGGDLRSPPFAATRPPQMRPAMSSDGYGQGYGPPPHAHHPQQQQQHPGAALRSPTGYATSEFGMRTAIGSPPLQATLSGGGGGSSSNGPPAPSFPFPQRPHTFHDAGYYHHHPHQQHLASGGMQHRASPRPGPAPIRPAPPPENPYTQALFPQSSSRQVSEFQRSGQSVGTVLSPGMTVQESMRQQQSQHGQQGQAGSYHHYGFGPREPRVQHHHTPQHGQGHPQAWQQQQQHGGGGHHPATWDHGYGAQHPQQQQQQFRPYPAPPAGLDPRYGPAPGQGRMPLSPRPPPQAPTPVLPTSIPLGVHQNAQASPASFAQPPSQQPTFHQQAQPQPQARTSIPSSSDRSSTSSYVSSSAGSFHHPHAQHQQGQHHHQQQQQHGHDYSAEGAAARGAYYGGYNINDDANTAPTSARSSRSGPPLSPESATAAGGGKGQQQQRDRAGSGAGSANAQSPFKRAPTPGSMAMARGYSDGGSSSRGIGGGHDGSAAQQQQQRQGQSQDDEEEEELDLSKIRPLPQPPTSAGGTPLSPSHAQMHPRSPSQHREDEGTLKAAQWAAMLGRSASDGGGGAAGGGGSDTLRQAKPPNSATTQSPLSALTTTSTQESSASGSTSTPTPSRIGVAGDGTEQQQQQQQQQQRDQVTDPEPGTGTFASFASFADDDDDTEGGTWAKPLDAMPAAAAAAATPTPAPAAAAAASSSSSSASAQDMAPSVTLRPPSTGIVGRPAASSMPGSPSLSQPPRVNSPRRPELRLTIDSPRAQSPLPPGPGHAPIPSPRGPRASPGAAGTGGGVSPRLGNDGTLMPSNSGGGGGGGGSATLTPSGIQRSSSFARRGDNEWALRPPPEQLYENLDDFFPRHDLDKPVLELGPGAPMPPPPPSASGYAAAGLPSAAAPMTTAAHHQQQAPSSPSSQHVAHSPTSANALARHKKSIRRVAQDRVRGAGLTMTTAAAGPTPSSSSAAAAGGNNIGATPSRASVELARRPSTKLWGTKLLEVTPGHEQSASGSSSASSSSSSSSSSSGRPVFKWVKGDLIGKGTYGRVYIALNATTGEMIAVKQVELPTTEHDRHDARQRDVVAALKSEISTLKDLDHPHIVSYLGFEETPEHLHLFLEYVPGGSIASVLRKYGKLEEGIIKYFVHQVLSGLSYLHERGVLHRDLKGDNLLVNLDGTVKISDFGTMRKSDDIYADVAGMSLQGSVFWMAPEVVLLTKKGYSAKVDIWSLGCVTLEMFAGRRPWSDDEAVQAMFKIGKEGRAPPVPPDVRLSREAAHFLRNCFFIDPNERPTAARLLDHVFPDVPGGWEFRETRLWRMMQRSLMIRAQAQAQGQQAGAGQQKQ